MNLATDATSSTTATSLRRFLDERGIRYRWVAAKLGISPAHMTRLMDGERPLTAVNAQRLAVLFGVEVETFLPTEEVT